MGRAALSGTGGGLERPAVLPPIPQGAGGAASGPQGSTEDSLKTTCENLATWDSELAWVPALPWPCGVGQVLSFPGLYFPTFS